MDVGPGGRFLVGGSTCRAPARHSGPLGALARGRSPAGRAAVHGLRLRSARVGDSQRYEGLVLRPWITATTRHIRHTSRYTGRCRLISSANSRRHIYTRPPRHRWIRTCSLATSTSGRVISGTAPVRASPSLAVSVRPGSSQRCSAIAGAAVRAGFGAPKWRPTKPRPHSDATVTGDPPRLLLPGAGHREPPDVD